MAIIEGFRIKNFGTLRNVTMGRLYDAPKEEPLTPLTVIIGKNGAGKSTLFDAFGFLADCLKMGVEEACDAGGRGGFDRLVSNGVSEPIEFEIHYKENRSSRPITYELFIDKDKSSRPYVLRERLRQRRKNQVGRPYLFLFLDKGKGWAWKGEYEGIAEEDIGKMDLTESNERESIELRDSRKLGIATLGALKQHPRIADFMRFIESWYLCYFNPDASRSLPLSGPQKHLNMHGDNLGNVVQFMERDYPKQFASILKQIAEKIPGIDKIDTEKTSDGRLLVRFNNKGFKDPFYAQQMSDGTLKLFAYLLLLNDPTPPPFICIEEPENGLYHELFTALAHELRKHTSGPKEHSQIFVTTHQPYFVDALEPQEVWILEKGEDGFSTIRRASDMPEVNNLVAEELPLGGLWYSGYLDK
jgi:predicted ATPase